MQIRWVGLAHLGPWSRVDGSPDLLCSASLEQWDQAKEVATANTITSSEVYAVSMSTLKGGGPVRKSSLVPMGTGSGTYLIKPRHRSSYKLGRVPWGLASVVLCSTALDSLRNKETFQSLVDKLSAAVVWGDHSLQCR